MKNSYKLVAIDLDGTLLRSDDTLSQRSAAALRHLRRQNIPIVICTGRGPRDLKPILAEISDADDRILCNGALVCSRGTRVVHGFESSDVFEIIHFLHENGCDAVIQDAEGIRYARPFQQINEAYHFVEPVLRARVRIVENFSSPFQHPIIRVSAWTTRERAESLYGNYQQKFTGKYNAYLFDYAFWVFEMLNAQATKAKALGLIAERTGILPSHIVAFGDGMNDVEMLRWAGLGIAMSNGDPLALAAADRIAPSNNEDGVAQLINELFPSVQSD